MARLWLALASLFSLTLPAGRSSAQEPAAVRGIPVLQMQGCIACHSLDGSPSAGPTFFERFGRPTRVIKGGVEMDVMFDAAYVQSSLEDPSGALVPGYAPGIMPRFVLSPDQLAAVTRAIAALGPTHRPPQRPLPVASLLGLLGCAAAVHLALWWRGVRDFLTRSFGAPGHWAIYLFAQLACWLPAAWLIWQHVAQGY